MMTRNDFKRDPTPVCQGLELALKFRPLINSCKHAAVSLDPRFLKGNTSMYLDTASTQTINCVKPLLVLGRSDRRSIDHSSSSFQSDLLPTNCALGSGATYSPLSHESHS